MLTPRDKIRITLLLAGIVLLISGAAIYFAKDHEEQENHVFRSGAKVGAFAHGVPKHLAPWMIVGGAVAIVGVFLSQD